MKPYADTNFITRFYLTLPGSVEAVGAINKLQAHGDNALPLTWHHRLETINAFQLLVFASRQSARQPRVTSEQAAMAMMMFRGDVATPTFFHLVPMSLEELEPQYEELSLRYGATHGFRTYDLIHVASALVFGCDAFWSFDRKTSRLAALEGFKTLG